MVEFDLFSGGRPDAERNAEDAARAVRRVIGAQAAVTAAAAAAALAFGETIHTAYSALIGGAIGFATAWIYARTAFAPRRAEARLELRAHYRAEGLKLASTIALFAAVLMLYKDVSTLALLLTYIATLAVYWAALLFV